MRPQGTEDLFEFRCGSVTIQNICYCTSLRQCLCCHIVEVEGNTKTIKQKLEFGIMK